MLWCHRWVWWWLSLPSFGAVEKVVVVVCVALVAASSSSVVQCGGHRRHLVVVVWLWWCRRHRVVVVGVQVQVPTQTRPVRILISKQNKKRKHTS